MRGLNLGHNRDCGGASLCREQAIHLGFFSLPFFKVQHFVSNDFPEYERFLQEHSSALFAGAPYPDYMYACGEGEAAEDTHWTPFQVVRLWKSGG